MGKFNSEYNNSGKHADRVSKGALPRFLEARWDAIACKSDDELDQKVLSRSDSDDRDYLNYISI